MDNDDNALKQSFLEALKESEGVLQGACDAIGISRKTALRWRKADPDFNQDVVDIMKDYQIDLVESKLMERIKAGDTTAIIFYLKTKGKNRGYSEKAVPDEPVKTVPAEVRKEQAKATQKRIRAKKDYITKLLKKEGKYTAELTYQVTITAELIVRREVLQEEMCSPDYQQVLVEYSREGNKREQVNPKEKLFLDLTGQVQRALRALGMNTDAKERKTDNDGFGDFLEQFNSDEQ